MTKTALITGLAGRDGAYLAGLLIAKANAAHTVKLRPSSFDTKQLEYTADSIGTPRLLA